MVELLAATGADAALQVGVWAATALMGVACSLMFKISRQLTSNGLLSTQAVTTLVAIQGKVETVALQSSQLHEAHLGSAAKTSDGAPKWWFPQKFPDMLQELSKSIGNLDESLTGLKRDTATLVAKAEA